MQERTGRVSPVPSSSPLTTCLPVTELRREARLIENEIDSKLLLLSKCNVRDDDDDDGHVSSDKVPLLQVDSQAGLFGRLSREIESLLSRLTDVNNRMVCVAERIRSSSATYTLQRHRDILNDYTKEFRKTKTSVEANQDREKLFQTNIKKGDTVIPMTGNAVATSSLLTRESESVRK